MLDSLKGRGIDTGGASFRFDVGHENGPPKYEAEKVLQNDADITSDILSSQQEQAAAQARLEISRQIALDEAESTFPGKIGEKQEEDPFADPAPEPPKTLLQKIRKSAWAPAVFVGSQLLRLLAGSVTENLDQMKMHEEAAKGAGEVAGLTMFESGPMHHEMPEIMNDHETEATVQAIEHLLESNHMTPESVLSTEPEGTLLHTVAEALVTHHDNVHEASSSLHLSHTEVKSFTDELYGHYVDANKSMSFVEDMAGNRIGDGASTIETVHLDSLKAFDIYGSGMDRVSPAHDLLPLIAAGNGMTMEQLNLHHELVSAAMMSHGETEGHGSTTSFYGKDGGPELSVLFGDAENSAMLQHAMATAVEMATWSVTEGGVDHMSPEHQAGYTAAFGEVVHGQVDVQHAWYDTGTALHLAIETGDAGASNAQHLAEHSMPNLTEKQSALESAWTHLASFEDGDGAIHAAATNNLSAEHGRALSFNEHASKTGVLPDVWAQQKDALSASHGQLASR